MSDTQVLLSKISALRQRLEQAQGLVTEAGSAVVDLAPDAAAGRLRNLERQAAAGFENNAQLDGVLRQLEDTAGPAIEGRILPAQLTARARRVLERSRELLERVRGLTEEAERGAPPTTCGPSRPGDQSCALFDQSQQVAPGRGQAAPGRAGRRPQEGAGGKPLLALHRETAAMLESLLRMIQAFPDSPSGQLRLCEGVEAILNVVSQRVHLLTAALQRRGREQTRIETLADLLTGLYDGRALDVKPYALLAEDILAEAQESLPLRFLHAGVEVPARFVACHSLTVAQVVARLVRHEPELRGRPVEPVLAALIHDVGMLGVPVEVLAKAAPLVDAERRLVEAHVRISVGLASRLLPGGTWLVEAVGGHHERLDGTGYPDGLREFQLRTLPRLLAVGDVYAAFCSPRPHRPARETRTALADTLVLAEQGALDRYQAERLLQLSFYPVGSVVELADGAVAVVVATHGTGSGLQTPARPVVSLLTDGQGQFLAAPQPLDLALCESRSIVRTLPPDERCDLLGRRYPELAA
jgi:HD-GYP domain-containing protein (c-di-GMP phosphodiesterase class II)